MGPVADGPRAVFVLGVYPSAVHARWVTPDGEQAIRIMAVDNEPEPFWTGHGVDDIIRAVNEDLPDGVGHLEPAERNGPSGTSLDALYLEPLGFTRADCWITDVHDRWLANKDQIKALERAYRPLVDAGRADPYALQLRPRWVSLDPRRSALLHQEWERAEPELVITLGAEPAEALGLPGPSREAYGAPVRRTCWGRQVLHLALAHPRHAGGLGKHLPAWAERHRAWAERHRAWTAAAPSLS